MWNDGESLTTEVTPEGEAFESDPLPEEEDDDKEWQYSEEKHLLIENADYNDPFSFYKLFVMDDIQKDILSDK